MCATKLHSETLLANSLQAMLASIEIYNKPDFKYREQVFTILNVNAWELLLKAKIINNEKEKIESLYALKRDGMPKFNRSGNPMTIEILACISRLSLDQMVSENIKALVEIRDTVIHFYHDDSLSYLVYTLGVASLRNYQRLIKDWFSRSLLEYNFYILPMAFAYNFKTLSILDLEKKQGAVSNLIKSVNKTQSLLKQSEDYYFVCEVSTEIKSAKKFAGDPDFTTSIDPGTLQNTTIVIKEQRLIDKYPISYKQLFEKVRQSSSGAKQSLINKIIKQYKIKSNPKLSACNFLTKAHEEKYKKDGILPKGITSIYNEDAIRFVIEKIEEKDKKFNSLRSQCSPLEVSGTTIASNLGSDP
jgi:hypothetical protein